MGKKNKYRCNSCDHLFYASDDVQYCPNCNKANLTKLTFYELIKFFGATSVIAFLIYEFFIK